MGKLFIAYAKLFRLSGLAGLSMAPVFGALSLIHLGITINLFTIFLIFLIGILKSIFGFVQNDIFDIEVDRMSEEPDKRPLVSGVITKKIAVIICIICALGAFSIAFIFFYKNHFSFYFAVLSLALAAIFGSIYNMYGKKFASSPFIAALADALLVLLGAYLVSPNGNLSIFTWVIFILVYNQFLFMTIITGGLKDADHDYLMNVKNIAILTGVKITKDKKLFIPISFKILGLIIRFTSAFIIFLPFILYRAYFELWGIILLSIFVVLVLYLSINLLNMKTLDNKKEIIKYFAIQGVLRYSLIPILIVPLIGIIYAFILIIFPLIWYFAVILISGKDIAPNLQSF